MKKKEKSKKEKRRNIFLDIFEFLVEGVLAILDAISESGNHHEKKERKEKTQKSVGNSFWTYFCIS